MAAGEDYFEKEQRGCAATLRFLSFEIRNRFSGRYVHVGPFALF